MICLLFAEARGELHIDQHCEITVDARGWIRNRLIRFERGQLNDLIRFTGMFDHRESRLFNMPALCFFLLLFHKRTQILWVAGFISPKKHNRIIYFDMYSLHLRVYSPHFTNLVDSYENRKSFVNIARRIQGAESHVCGLYVTWFTNFHNKGRTEIRVK